MYLKWHPHRHNYKSWQHIKSQSHLCYSCKQYVGFHPTAEYKYFTASVLAVRCTNYSAVYMFMIHLYTTSVILKYVKMTENIVGLVCHIRALLIIFKEAEENSQEYIFFISGTLYFSWLLSSYAVRGDINSIFIQRFWAASEGFCWVI